MAAAPTRCDVARVSDGYAGATARALEARPQAASTLTRSVQFIKAAVSAPQSTRIGYEPVINTRAVATPSAGHHASRNRTGANALGQPQRSVRIEQFVLMDALGRRD
jgi:hypothetical protein